MYRDHITEDDLALYAMRSLSPADLAEVQKHLNTCGDCRKKLADILGDLSLLALTVPQVEIPDGARDRFIRRLRTESGFKTPAPVAPAGRPRPEPARSGNWFGSLGWIAAAAALLFAAYMGNTAHFLHSRLDDQQAQIAKLSGQAARAQQILDVLTAPNAKRVVLTEAKSPAQPTAHVVYVKDKGALILVASNLKPIPQNKTYELWVIPSNGQPSIPAGLFRPDAAGSASLVLPSIPTGVDAKAFGVTVEDTQGSATPTLPIVMVGQ